jgi:DmsA/YnfE family anaerobic dimethyl sulfoxide reductase A subunit
MKGLDWCIIEHRGRGDLNMGTDIENKALSRRTFVKGASLTALAATAGSGAVTTLYGCSGPSLPGGGGKAGASEEKVAWVACSQTCGGAHPLRFHIVDGELKYVETDNTGDANGLQNRSCGRGRSIRRLINHPDRLKFPMKRVGARGSGEFEQITWDEAEELFASKLKHTIDTYGNEAVCDCTNGDVTKPSLSFFRRLANSLGGSLNLVSGPSAAMAGMASVLLYGAANILDASKAIEAKNADLLMMFGRNQSEMELGGCDGGWDIVQVRESGTEIISIDYRLNETSLSHPEEWQPIRTGTDAALASAMAYVLITEDMVDTEFLGKYVVGYDEGTMPEGVPPNTSYKDYILGTGYDKVPKTPEWAAPITQIPATRIVELAHKLGKAKAAFVVQGLGPQRHSNGESTTVAIAALALLTGNIGLPGTNTGLPTPLVGLRFAAFPPFPEGENPVEVSIPFNMWPVAADLGTGMTATQYSVGGGVERLPVGIKFLFSHKSNLIANQTAQINRIHDILADESKVEFIAVSDIFLTNSCTYADLVLPDVTKGELLEVYPNGYTSTTSSLSFSSKALDAPPECKPYYDFIAAVAEKLGVKEAFTENRSWDEWVEALYEQGREANPDIPTFEELREMGSWTKDVGEVIGLSAFRKDPDANPLSTPSGKIELFSGTIAFLSSIWELADPTVDVLMPVPGFFPGFEGYTSLTEDYPLLLSGFHYKGRANSTWTFVDTVTQAFRNQVWINPLDAEARGIQNGDMTHVSTPRGTVEIEAKVTPRIIPGTIAIPQGSQHKADMFGDKIDKGGCINTLTSLHPSPLAKGNIVNSNIAQVVKL